MPPAQHPNEPADGTSVAEARGYSGSPIYAPLRKGEIQRICLDCSKAQRELGWQPKLDFRQGIAQTVGYYRSLSRP